MSAKKVFVETAAYSIAQNMPDEFPDGFAYFLAEMEWEKRNGEGTEQIA